MRKTEETQYLLNETYAYFAIKKNLLFYIVEYKCENTDIKNSDKNKSFYYLHCFLYVYSTINIL